MFKFLFFLIIIINKSQSYIIVYEGENIQIHCPFPKDTPNLSWNRESGIPVIFITYKDKNNIETVRVDKQSFPKFGLHSGSLTISNVKVSDSNTYYCAVDGAKFPTTLIVVKKQLSFTTFQATTNNIVKLDTILGFLLLSIFSLFILSALIFILLCYLNQHKYGKSISNI